MDSAFAFLKYEGSLPDYLHLFEIGNEVDLPKKQVSAIKTAIQSMTTEEIAKTVPLRDEDELRALFKRKGDLESVHTIKDIIELYRGAKR